MNCLICNASTNLLFEKIIMNTYNAEYRYCASCDFVFVAQPYWLDEAYSSAITDLDLGLVQRNLMNAKLSARIINFFFHNKASFYDAAGGYGLFTRLMRDSGFDFYHTDPYCQNLFAKDFELIKDKKYELVTAYEVMEHIVSPLAFIDSITKHTDNILFSTDIMPSLDTIQDWDYLSLPTGQHIRFYSTKALQVIAQKIGLHYASNGISYHIFSKKKIHSMVFKIICSYRWNQWDILSWRNNPSLLMNDYQNKLKTLSSQ